MRPYAGGYRARADRGDALKETGSMLHPVIRTVLKTVLLFSINSSFHTIVCILIPYRISNGNIRTLEQTICLNISDFSYNRYNMAMQYLHRESPDASAFPIQSKGNHHDKGMEDIYVTEKIGNKTGWQNIFLEEPLMRGYIGEMQDFMECIAFNRKPHSDYGIAAKTIEVIYAAYCSAQEGRRLELDL